MCTVYCKINAWQIEGRFAEGRKWLVFFTPLACLTPPFEFLDETYPAKTSGIALSYGENCIILTSTFFDRYGPILVRRTDGRTDGRTSDSI